MAARRLILAMLVLLVLSSILAALVPVERDRLAGDSTSTTTTDTQAEEPPPTGDLVRRSVRTGVDEPERIEIALGDQLDLTVTSDEIADLVEIPEFGALQNVDPDFPAHFDVLAVEQGSFPVRLVDSGRVIARIEVGPEPDQEGKAKSKSKDSPGSNTDNSTPGATSLS